MTQRVLVVDDDASLADLVTRCLAGGTAPVPATPPVPALVVLDLGPNGADGPGLLGELGAEAAGSGPFPPPALTTLLTARVTAALRRAAAAPFVDARPTLRFGALELDVAAREVHVDGAPVPLTAREFDLLAFMAARPRRALRRDELLAEVWGFDIGSTATVTVHVRRLREKIEADPSNPRWITTVRGVGYRFDPGAG